MKMPNKETMIRTVLVLIGAAAGWLGANLSEDEEPEAPTVTLVAPEAPQ